MGCDGGTIPKRVEMVKLKKKAQKADKDMELQAQWKYCALSGEELKPPTVACDLGRLYNKEAVLMALLDKSNIPEIARHIRSLKDVTVLQLTVNPSYKPSGKADTYNDTQAAEYACPVTGLEMSGRYRFVYLKGCGCVFSEKALKEVPSETCNKCGCVFSKDQVVPLNVGEEDEKAMREAMEEKRRQARLAKRKRKAAVADDASATTSSGATGIGSSSSGSGTSSGSDKESPPPGKKQKLPQETASSSSSSELRQKPKSKSKSSGATVVISNGAFASQPVPVGASKLSKLSGTSNASASEKDKVTETAESRKAYKSLFTSNAGERPKEKTSHWVTFFPYH